MISIKIEKMRKQKRTNSDIYQIAIVVLFLLLLRILLKNVETTDELCLTISQDIAYKDLAISKVSDEYEKVQSSEKFQKLANSYSESSSRGGGANIGFGGFEIGGNAEVSNAWSKSTSTETKDKRYQSESAKTETTYQEGYRQLFKEVTTELKIEMNKDGRQLQSSVSKYVKEKYWGSVSVATCPNRKQDRLYKLAQQDIIALAKDKPNVKIWGTYNTSLTERHCGKDSKHMNIIKIITLELLYPIRLYQQLFH